jgi:integrase
MLNDRQIRGLKPAAKHQFLSDGGGLYLRVHPTGKKQFVYRSRAGGRARWRIIGDYGTLTLAEARRLAQEQQGRSPGDTTVAQAFDEFYRNVIQRDFKRPEQVLARARLDVLPTLGSRRVADVTRAEVADMLQRIVDRGSPVSANRTMADVKQLFLYCVVRGWIPHSPTDAIRQKYVGGREKARDRTLDDAEIEGLFTHLHKMYPLAAAVLYLCLLTGQRIGEVLGLSRQEMVGSLWVIPADRTKSHREHKVYLSLQARAALRLLFALADRPFAELSKHTPAQTLQRLQVGYTPHDLRRTVATRLASLGVMPHIIEKILNHRMSGVMAVYNRAEYLPEREAALRQWGQWVAQKRRAGR